MQWSTSHLRDVLFTVLLYCCGGPGTDTLEQTAWFLQCIQGVGDQSKPLVITGDMLGAEDTFAVVPQNTLSAAVVAASTSPAWG